MAHAISKALKDIARKKPLIVLNTSSNYLIKHAKVCIHLCIYYLIISCNVILFIYCNYGHNEIIKFVLQCCVCVCIDGCSNVHLFSCIVLIVF